MQEIVFIFVILSYISLMKCDMEAFVVGGKKARIQQFPHSAFLHVSCMYDHKNQVIRWMCGGSIVNDRIVMTAAHCLYGCNNKSVISVSVGHSQRSKGAVSSAKSYLVHERFILNVVNFDLALVVLKTSLKFDANVKRIALMKNPPYSETAQIAGWGAIKEYPDVKYGKDLMYIDQNVWKRKACKQVIKSVPKGAICASSGSGSSYSSSGDSGSALVVRGYIQIGIVSYKVPKVSRSLVVYTDTGYFYDWIKKNSKRLYCV